jgi:hypothetical protein
MLPEAECFLSMLILIQATFGARLVPAALDYLSELQRHQERVETYLWQLNRSSERSRGATCSPWFPTSTTTCSVRRR